MVKRVNMYKTDISDLTSKINKDTVFISGWDKDEDILNIDDDIVIHSIMDRKNENTYIMSKNMYETKDKICNYLKRHSSEFGMINRHYVTICSNASISGFLSILQINKCKDRRLVIIGPIFFTYLHMCSQLGIELYNIDINVFDEDSLELQINIALEEIREWGISNVLITNPLLRTGVSLPLECISKIAIWCEKKRGILIIDNVYGNMEWGIKKPLADIELIELAYKYKSIILFDSLAKRIFKNGIKSSVIYANRDVINDIEKDSEFFVGSVTYLQESLLKNAFELQYESKLLGCINEALELSRMNYDRIQEFLGKNLPELQLTKVTNGYFVLGRYPRKYLGNESDDIIARNLLEKFNVLVIPHSRYHYSSNEYFYFSINLVANISRIVNDGLGVFGEVRKNLSERGV